MQTRQHSLYKVEQDKAFDGITQGVLGFQGTIGFAFDLTGGLLRLWHRNSIWALLCIVLFMFMLGLEFDAGEMRVSGMEIQGPSALPLIVHESLNSE